MAEGPNLIVNGTFPIDIGGWSFTNLGQGGQSFLWDSNGGGRAVVSVALFIPIIFVSNIVAWQAVTVVPFTNYKATWDIKIAGLDDVGEVSHSARTGVGLAESDLKFEHGMALATTTGIKTIEFTTGAESTVYVGFNCGVGSGSFDGNNSFNFDDVTLREQLSGLFSPRIMVL